MGKQEDCYRLKERGSEILKDEQYKEVGGNVDNTSPCPGSKGLLRNSKLHILYSCVQKQKEEEQ